MQKSYRILAVGFIVTAILASAAVPAFASAKGRKNTAMVLTAATVHQFLTKKDRNAVVLGLASAQAWKNYEDARKRESRQTSAVAGYRQEYRSTSAYRPSTSRQNRSSNRAAYSTSRSYQPKRSYAKRTTTYARPASTSRTAYYRRSTALPSRAYTTSQSSTQVAQLKAQVADLKHQVAVNKLAAENSMLKSELAKQRVLIASARSEAAATRKLTTGLIIAVAAMFGVFGISRLPFRVVRKTE